jgi:hypothetical protein
MKLKNLYHICQKLAFWKKQPQQTPEQAREAGCVYNTIYPELYKIFPEIFPSACWQCDGYGRIDANSNLCNDYFPDSASAQTAIIELAENERDNEPNLLKIIKNHAREHARAITPEQMTEIDKTVSIFIGLAVTKPLRIRRWGECYTQQKMIYKKELRKTTTVLMKPEQGKQGKN